VWLPSAVVLSVYAYALETIQHSRGLDPRFSEAGAPIDAILSGVFLLDALGLIAMFVVLAVLLVRRGLAGADGLILLAVRYAIGATALAFAAGDMDDYRAGRHTGRSGMGRRLLGIAWQAAAGLP
jgi:hypothetical protein